MNHTKFVAYYRVSTKKQGQSGLGLDAQRTCIECVTGDGEVIGSFTDIESGKKRNRVELHKAIELCKASGATLIIYQLDRLARDVRFIFELRESGVQFMACDLPDFNTLTLGMFASFAQYEREKIAERTKAALAAKKKRDGGEWWGVSNLNEAARGKAYARNTAKARSNENNTRAIGFINVIRKANPKVSLRGIASELNSSGFKTSQGKVFTAVQVARLIERISK